MSWSPKRQPTISRSSAEAEYRGVVNVVSTWLHNLSLELLVPLRKTTTVYCDNVSTVYLSQYLVQHQRIKHVEIDVYFVREKVRLGHIRILHIPASMQFVDIFTKRIVSLLVSTVLVQFERQSFLSSNCGGLLANNILGLYISCHYILLYKFLLYILLMWIYSVVFLHYI